MATTAQTPAHRWHRILQTDRLQVGDVLRDRVYTALPSRTVTAVDGKWIHFDDGRKALFSNVIHSEEIRRPVAPSESPCAPPPYYRAVPGPRGTWMFHTASGSSSGYLNRSTCQGIATATEKQDREAARTGIGHMADLLRAHFAKEAQP